MSGEYSFGLFIVGLIIAGIGNAFKNRTIGRLVSAFGFLNMVPMIVFLWIGAIAG